MVTTDPPLSTIAVIEREGYSSTLTALEALLAHTPEPRRIVVVTGGGPRAARNRLERFVAEHDITLITGSAHLNANEERNLAMRHVQTEYVAFVDNDSIVGSGWLHGLERCATETGAALVLPVVTWGRPNQVTLHYAGGTTRIVDDNGGRRLEQHDEFMGCPLDDLATLERAPTTTVEMHCVLARTDVLRRIAPFDESLMNARDRADLALRLAADGGSIWLEPAVVVHYLWPKRLKLSDYPFYVALWSDEWRERSDASFNEKWQIDDTSAADLLREPHRNRRLRREPWPPGWRGDVARARFRLRVRIDRYGTPLIIRYFDRRRARAAPARVAYTASWDTFARDVTVRDNTGACP